MKTMMLTMLFLMVACEKSGTNEQALFQSTPPISDRVSFETLRSFILGPKCVSCHGWVNDEALVRNRVVAGNALGSSLYIRMANGSMPQGGPALTSAQLAVVEAYINGSTTAEPIPAVAPTYASLKINLFQNSCTGCHKPGGRSPNLNDLNEIRDEITSIEEQLDFGLMPPLDDDGNPKAPVPTQEILDAFREWVINGMPN